VKRILIIDDDTDTCQLLSSYLAKKGFETDISFSGHKGIEKYKELLADIVLCDYRLGDREGSDVLKEVKRLNPKAKVIIITGYSDIKTAVKVMKQGAFDYIAKPLIPEEVFNVVSQACNSSDIASPAASHDAPAAPASSLKSRPVSSTGYMVGIAPATQELYRQVELIAPTNYSVILYGESGTGKEVIAKTIHQYSQRRDKPFVALDCGTLSKELAGSELFGHVKGAFTGALNDKTGHFELAHGGTLFLDEVANLSPEIQASLLRVIQERKFKRIGGTKEFMVDTRLIIASNENLEEAYQQGKFREDLFHRFNEFCISIPPLRERKEDIPAFARYFLEKINAELGKQITDFDDEVMEAFVHYAWPGNIREFKNVLRRMALLSNGSLIEKRYLPWTDVTRMEHAETQLANTETNAAEKTYNLKNAAFQAEYEAIMKVLKQVNYNKSMAANILKIDRKTLYNKLKIFREGHFS